MRPVGRTDMARDSGPRERGHQKDPENLERIRRPMGWLECEDGVVVIDAHLRSRRGQNFLWPGRKYLRQDQKREGRGSRHFDCSADA